MRAGPVLCLGHAVRRFTLGTGPLKRGTDRLHLLLRVLLAGSLALTPAVGAAAGTAARASLSADAVAAAAQLTEVVAVLRADPVRSSGGADETVWVAASWTSPSGHRVQGRTLAPPGARTGDRTTVWVTETGERRAAPPTSGEIGLRATTIAVVAGLAAVLAAGSAYLGGVVLLDRARSRRWATGWEIVEPQWRREQLR